MKKVNELTRRLLAEGWLPEDTPPGTRPYLDYEGGWTYTSEAICGMVWETPCGLLADPSTHAGWAPRCVERVIDFDTLGSDDYNVWEEPSDQSF